jgi:hypothetical protein
VSDGDLAHLVDRRRVEVFAEREERTVDNERVVVVETVHERIKDVIVVNLDVSDLIQRLAPHGDVVVVQGVSPIIGRGELLTDRAAKGEDSVSRV